MKKAALCLLCCLLLAGCTPPSDPNVDVPRPSSSSASDGRDAIPFGEGDLYAAAYLGYLEMEDLDFYQARYLDGREPPVHYFSAGEFYLVIPRYEGTALSLYHNDINTQGSTLVYQDPDCGPFIIQCNVSDIFPDATIRLTYGEESVEFSPYISLRDGSVEIGPGCLLTAEDAGA